MTYIQVPSNIGIGVLAISFPYGSDYETTKDYGIAHLLEHMMCKSFDHLLPKFKRLGISSNAYTTTDKTYFYISGLNESLKEVGQEFYDCVTQQFNYEATQESFLAERSTVHQEILDAFNSHENGFALNALRQHYNYFCAIGDKDVVNAFQYDDYLDARSKYKVPTTICEVGDNYIELPDQYMLVPSLVQNIKWDNYVVPQEVVPKNSKTHVFLLGKILHDQISLNNKLQFICDCLNDGLESPLSQEIRDKRGLSYFSQCNTCELKQKSILSLGATTSNERTQELLDVYREFLTGDLTRHLTRERFNDCMQSHKIQEKKCKLLPHHWAFRCVLERDPFTGVSDLSYEDALKLLVEHFDISKFEQLSY